MALVTGVTESSIPPIQRLHPVKTRLGVSIASLVSGVVVAGVTALALYRFYDSLGVGDTARAIWAAAVSPWTCAG